MSGSFISHPDLSFLSIRLRWTRSCLWSTVFTFLMPKVAPGSSTLRKPAKNSIGNNFNHFKLGGRWDKQSTASSSSGSRIGRAKQAEWQHDIDSRSQELLEGMPMYSDILFVTDLRQDYHKPVERHLMIYSRSNSLSSTTALTTAGAKMVGRMTRAMRMYPWTMM